VGVLADPGEVDERCQDELELGPERLAIDAALRGARASHAATWFPDELPPGDTWLLVLMKVAGALVMNLGPTTVSAGRTTAGAAVAAPAVDTGAASAIALRAAATPTSRVRVAFMSNLVSFACLAW
jgi:hypothetical protein